MFLTRKRKVVHLKFYYLGKKFRISSDLSSQATPRCKTALRMPTLVTAPPNIVFKHAALEAVRRLTKVGWMRSWRR